MYVQVIPLFTKSDDDVFRFITENFEEIDQTTGSSLQFVLPKVARAGEAAGIAELFSIRGPKGRYSGLLRSDLPCFWVEDEKEHVIILMPNGAAAINQYIRSMTDAAEAGKDARGIKAWVGEKIAADFRERNPIAGFTTALLRSAIEDLGMKKSTERLLALIFGISFITAILVLAVAFPSPSAFQYQVFRIVLALAAAGFVSMTPGFIEVTISKFLRAGGALAVFAIVYFYNPAALVAS
jgi:hypothetical protein